MRIRDLIREEGYDKQRDADAVSGKPRKLSVGGGKKPKGYSKDKAEKAAMDNVKKALAKKNVNEGQMSFNDMMKNREFYHTYKEYVRGNANIDQVAELVRGRVDKEKFADEVFNQGVRMGGSKGSRIKDLADIIRKDSNVLDLPGKAFNKIKKMVGMGEGEADMDFSDKTEELSMWLAKWDEYKGSNGDALPMGWIKGMTSTGVISDGYEWDELEAFEKKIGKEEMEWEDDDYKEFLKPENSPITNKMYNELAKIIGTKDRGEEVADAVASALGMGESVEVNVQENELPKSPKVLKLVIDDLKKFKAEQEEAKKQGYDEDVRMMQGRIDDMMDIANLIKDGGYLSGVDTSLQDLIVDYYEKAGEPLPFARESITSDINRIKDLAGIAEEATAGGTMASDVSVVVNPVHAHGQIPRDKNGVPKKKSKKNADGTVVNALDASDSFFGAKVAKR